MQKETQSRRTNRDTDPDRAGALIWLGRFLLALSAISLLTSPLTQQLWSWDHFLHGGQDFELAALMIFTALALVVVLSKQCGQYVHVQLGPLCLLARESIPHPMAGDATDWQWSIAQTGPAAGRLSSSYSIPLQI